MIARSFSSVRRRGLTRGAAFAESIIVIAMTALFMAGGVFFHRFYAEKIHAMQDSRKAAWSGSFGCATGLGLPGVAGVIWTSFDTLADCVDGADCSIGSAIDSFTASGGDEPPEWFGDSGAENSTVRYEVTAHAKIGGRTYHPGAYNRVACNEKPQHREGDIIGILQYARDSFLPSDSGSW